MDYAVSRGFFWMRSSHPSAKSESNLHKGELNNAEMRGVDARGESTHKFPKANARERLLLQVQFVKAVADVSIRQQILRVSRVVLYFLSQLAHKGSKVFELVSIFWPPNRLE
jgi:hypothetical protein